MILSLARSLACSIHSLARSLAPSLARSSRLFSFAHSLIRPFAPLAPLTVLAALAAVTPLLSLAAVASLAPVPMRFPSLAVQVLREKSVKIDEKSMKIRCKSR